MSNAITICNYNGKCINFCYCFCLNKNNCICRHTLHNKDSNYYYGYCPSNHCKLINCKNFNYCHLKRPMYCNFCAIYLNDFSNLDIITKCNNCLKSDYIVLLKCNHKICYNCVVNYSKCNDCNNIFPFCRVNNKSCKYHKYKCNICKPLL
jgi:hypothetical protein